MTIEPGPVEVWLAPVGEAVPYGPEYDYDEDGYPIPGTERWPPNPWVLLGG